MNKLQKNSIWLWLILAIISVIFLASCGSRKVNKSETNESQNTEVLNKDNSTTTTNTDSNVKIVDNSESEELTILPIDNSKEITINGKKYFNAILKNKKIKNNITTNESKKVSQIKQNNVKKAVKTNKVKTAEVKISEKENWFKWWYLLILALIVYVYWLYKKGYISF